MKGINWKRYYEEEAKLRKILPEEDPGEEVRVRLALSLIPKNAGSVLDVGCSGNFPGCIINSSLLVISESC